MYLQSKENERKNLNNERKYIFVKYQTKSSGILKLKKCDNLQQAQN